MTSLHLIYSQVYTGAMCINTCEGGVQEVSDDDEEEDDCTDQVTQASVRTGTRRGV